MRHAHPWPEHLLIKAEPGTLIWSRPLPDGGNAIVKLYRRRAFFEPLRRTFLPWRAEREYLLLSRLREHGVACPEPLAWSHGSSREHGRFECLESREIAGAAPLKQLLALQQPPDLRALFALVRRMHAVGVAHGALFTRNILVTSTAGPEPGYYLIDLAHGRAFDRDIADTRPADFDLLELMASIARERPLDRAMDWLAAYGMDAGRSHVLLGRLTGRWGGRLRRKLRRIEIDARVILASLFGPRRKRRSV